MEKRRRFLLALTVALCACSARSQLIVPTIRDDGMPAPTDATPECGRSPDASPSATVWHECEPICGTWTWDASRHVFTASWENGAVATLTLVEFDDCQVIVDRNDYAGSSNGLTAEYVGARSGNSTQGTVTWHGRAGDVHSGMWNATW